MASPRVCFLLCVVVCILYSGVQGKYVMTPFGKKHEVCVRKAGEGRKHGGTCDEAVADLEAADVASAPSSSDSASSGAGVADGTMAYSIANFPYNVIGAFAEFNVPNAPTQAGATIFIAFSLSDSTWTPPAPLPYPDMLQLEATLQWGKTAAGQVDGWGMVVWSKDFYGDILYSDLVAVEESTIITATMALGQDTGIWSMNMTALSSTGSLSVGLEAANTTTNGQSDDIYFGLMRYDAYFTASCDNLPPSGSQVVFSGVNITMSTGTMPPNVWVPGGLWAVPMCGSYPDIVSITQTRLFLNVCGTSPANTPGCSPAAAKK